MYCKSGRKLEYMEHTKCNNCIFKHNIKTRWIGLRCKSKNKNLSNCIASTSGKSKRPLYMEQTLCNSCILGTMSLPHLYSDICIFINIFVYLYISSLWGSVLLSCRGARRVHDTVPRPSGNFLHQVFSSLLFNLYFFQITPVPCPSGNLLHQVFLTFLNFFIFAIWHHLLAHQEISYTRFFSRF